MSQYLHSHYFIHIYIHIILCERHEGRTYYKIFVIEKGTNEKMKKRMKRAKENEEKQS